MKAVSLREVNLSAPSAVGGTEVNAGKQWVPAPDVVARTMRSRTVQKWTKGKEK